MITSIVKRAQSEADQIPGTNPPFPGTTNPVVSSIMSGHPGIQEIMIPGLKVGLIIGKGGETIKQLQEKSGAKMVIIQDGPGQENEKPLRITGDPQKVEHAKQLVYELIAEKEMQQYTKTSRPFNPAEGGQNEEIIVPKEAVGLVIGKGGEAIKQMRRETGAKLHIVVPPNEEGPGDRTCVITGPPDCVAEAKRRIVEMIDSCVRRNNGFPNNYWNRGNQDMTGKIEFSYPVPISKCGIIIGKGGETIKHINAQTGCHCELDRRNPGTDTEKYFILRGTPEQVENAKRIFSEKLGTPMPVTNMYGTQNPMGYYPTWNATPGYPAWPGTQPAADPNAAATTAATTGVQINPATGQPDYSAQWAEYYRSLGKHREAEMIEQQAKQQQAAAAAAAAPKPDMTQQAVQPAAAQQQPQQQQNAQQNGGQADYSAQWAEYYRSIGKIKEAEAIEAQMKSGKAGATMQPNQQQPQAQANPMPSAMPTPTGAPANAFPQPYVYPGMNPANPGYYTPGAQTAAAPGQNPAFPAANYQNYQYPQTSTEN